MNKKAILMGGGLLLASAVSSCQMVFNASAIDTPWGPERRTFTWADPAPYAVFNSITDNPGLGDERNFVRIKESSSNTFGDIVTLENGKVYDVYIYYHNNADAHEVGKTAIGIADNVKMHSSFPKIVNANEQLTVTGKITADDTNPVAVWDGAYVAATKKTTLSYVEGSATIHNGGALNGQPVGPDYLFGDGATLGYNEWSGILPGCNEYAGYVIYQIKATTEETPPPPYTPPETPVTPSEIPSTGPAEVIVAVVIVLAILGGGFYWLTTRKHLQKTTRAAAASRRKAASTSKKPAARKTTTRKATTRRAPVKRSSVKRATRKRAVKKVVRNKRK